MIIFTRVGGETISKFVRFAGGVAGLLIVSGCGHGPIEAPPSSVDSAAPAPVIVGPPINKPQPLVNKPQPLVPRPETARPSTVDSEAGAGRQSTARTPDEPSRSGGEGTLVSGLADAGAYACSLAADRAQSIWVGTEGQGVLCGKSDGTWRRYTSRDGLGDDNGYALCCDRLGRIWVGHQNHGVSVFNGTEWKNYGAILGPLGERVFVMVSSPLDGDIWIGTNLGLCRYRLSEDRWQYLTRLNGLPSDQIQAMAFEADGTLFVGTQCDGVGIASPKDNYATWRSVKGGLADEKFRNSSGKGIPSSQINDILVAKDGAIYIATNCGLAKSTDHGRTWNYVRGRDYDDKVQGRATSPPKGWKGVANDGALLPEDYITRLAEDAQGRVWMGFRQRGFAIAGASGGEFPPGKDQPQEYVRALLPMEDGRPYVGGYGSGVWRPMEPLPALRGDAGREGDAKVAAEAAPTPPLPSPASAPSISELRSLITLVEKNTTTLTAPSAIYLADDWSTQGDWVGRYGRQYTVLSAVDAPLNHHLVRNIGCRVQSGVGWHGSPGEQLRHWIHWKETTDRRTLYDPILGYRRQAEWDDHGEAYSMSHEGPDIWIAVEVGEGTHRLAMYFMNKDGESGHNRFRDYLVEIKPFHEDLKRADRLQTLAQARVVDFRGGVYKQFMVAGLKKYLVKIAKNDSFNTIVSSVMIDQVTGPPSPFDETPLPWMGDVKYMPPAVTPSMTADASPELTAACELMSALKKSRQRAGVNEMFRSLGHLAYRSARAADAPAPLLANWRWQLLLWNSKDREEFDSVMQRARRSWQQNNKHASIKP